MFLNLIDIEDKPILRPCLPPRPPCPRAHIAKHECSSDCIRYGVLPEEKMEIHVKDSKENKFKKALVPILKQKNWLDTSIFAPRK